jgi:hypothetical protein
MLTKDFERITVRDCGTALTVRISPCSWMYDGHGLQIQLQMSSKDISNGGVAYIHNKALRFEDATEADIAAMVAKVGIVRCSRCQKPAFDPAIVDTNRAGLCEECFMADLNAELEEAQAAEEARMKLIDAEMLAKGMSFRVDAWIHPKAGATITRPPSTSVQSRPRR